MAVGIAEGMKNASRHSFPNEPFDWTKRSASAVATGGSSLQGLPRTCPLYLSASAGHQFQHFIRSQKRRADSGLRDNDMQWDFWTLSPESAHQVTWLMGDRGIPRSWRHMNGYSSHTYMWVSAKGERFWVK
jgi:hypothetical protein